MGLVYTDRSNIPSLECRVCMATAKYLFVHHTHVDHSTRVHSPLFVTVGVESHTQRTFHQMPKFVPILSGDDLDSGDLGLDGNDVNLTYLDILDKFPKGHTREFKLKSTSETDMVMECFNECSKNELCQSWTLDVDGKTCYKFYKHVRLNGHRDGFYSGVKVHQRNAL